MRESRNEEDFHRLFEQIIEFSVEHDVDLQVKVRPKRTITISSRFKDCIVTSTLSQRELIGSEDEHRNLIFYPIIDSILVELDDRFSKSNLKILQDNSSLYPDSAKFSEMDNLVYLCNMIKCDVFTLSNEIEVLKTWTERIEIKTYC